MPELQLLWSVYTMNNRMPQWPRSMLRLLADAGATAHNIMAALGHLTLAEAERYTREADRRRGGRRAIVKLEDHKANKTPQTSSDSLGKPAKTKRKSI